MARGLDNGGGAAPLPHAVLLGGARRRNGARGQQLRGDIGGDPGGELPVEHGRRVLGAAGLRQGEFDVGDAPDAGDLLGGGVEAKTVLVAHARGETAVDVERLDGRDADDGDRVVDTQPAGDPVEQQAQLALPGRHRCEPERIVEPDHEDHAIVGAEVTIADPGERGLDVHGFGTDEIDVAGASGASGHRVRQLSGEGELVGDDAPAVARTVADEHDAVGLRVASAHGGNVPRLHLAAQSKHAERVPGTQGEVRGT